MAIPENSGSAFEARVACLLRSSPGYKNVREQQHIRGKNVDITFQKNWNPHKVHTIGVECKNWRSGLDRASLKDIFLDYEPLIEAGDIDELWVLTPHPVSPTVQEYADAFPRLEVLHISEFEQGIIDFSIYAGYLERHFTQGKLSQFYIPSRLEHSSTTLHEKVLEWLNEPLSPPIAVWAGYGMGKTSYATYLASQLATAFIKDPSNRIPIFIPLGDYYTAPRIDGLLANVLTNESGVHGYNFNTFWNLHEAGRFVIILDGFDEMKHAMTRQEFIAVSKEIRKLIIPNSRLLLLGRSDAIVSGEEHALLIKGSRQLSGLEVSDSAGTEFIEYRLDPFSESEYISFIERFLYAFYTGADKVSFVERRVKEIGKLPLADILNRPVQARMLAQILINPKNVIETVSKFDLYAMFIDECLVRESEKHERAKIDLNIRRKFMQDIAWWLWAFKRTRTFTVSDIPPTLTRNYIGGTQDPLGQTRELLVGSVLEEQSVGSLVAEKAAGTFYFPHLSFTEFLVAEYLIQRKLDDGDITRLSANFDGEVGSFLFSYKNDALFKIYNELKETKADISFSFVQFLSQSPTLASRLIALADKQASSVWQVSSVWQFSVDFLALMRVGRGRIAIPKCANLVASDQFRYTAIAVQLLIKALLITEVGSGDFVLASKSLLTTFFRGINIDKLAETVRSKSLGYRVVSETEEFLIGLLSHVKILPNNSCFSFNASDLYESALFAAKKNTLTDEAPAEKRIIQVRFSEVRRSLRTKHDQERFDKWLEAKRLDRSSYVFPLRQPGEYGRN